MTRVTGLAVLSASILSLLIFRPQAAPIQEKAAQAVKGEQTKPRTLSANWQVTVPFVACDQGKPVLNVDVPNANAPTPMCPNAVAPDGLPPNTPTVAQAAEDSTADVGTVIVLSVSREKIVLAADSRNVRLTTRRMTDGTTKREIIYDDSACKLEQLTQTTLFAADGLVWAGSTIPAQELYDAHKLARLAAHNYHPTPEDEQLPGGELAAIATRWAWDVDFRMHHGFAEGWTPIQTLEGIFAGLQQNGELAFAVAKLQYPKPRAGVRVPPVSFTVGTFSPLPTDFTWVEAFGMKDVAETYYSARAANEATRAENKRISAEILKNPAEFSSNIPERLVDLTVQHYEATTRPESPLFVHGPIDAVELNKGTGINWIRRKNCSYPEPTP